MSLDKVYDRVDSMIKDLMLFNVISLTHPNPFLRKDKIPVLGLDIIKRRSSFLFETDTKAIKCSCLNI